MAAPDRRIVQLRFGRSLGSYADNAVVQRAMAEQLRELIVLGTGEREFRRILEIGCGSGLFSQLLAAGFDYERIFFNDLAPAAAARVKSIARSEFLAGDIEELPLPDRLDLVAANAVFQWLREPEKVLRRLAGRMNSGGILAFSVFGPENCRETAALVGSPLTYHPAAVWRGWVEADFELIGFHEELYCLEFPGPEAVLAHLKQTGVTAGSGTQHWTRGRLAAFCRRYREEFGASGGGVTLTYHPIVLVGRKR